MNNARSPSCPVAILLSGRGSNMRALVEQSREGDAAYRIACVLGDNPAAGGLALARELGVPAHAVGEDAHRPGRAPSSGDFEGALIEDLERCGPALIVLAGFMRILSAEFIARYAGRIMNIHPSLLPKYRGLHTHRRALAAREREHGATVHFVTAELDAGAPVIQARIAVASNDDEGSLAARVLTQEHRIYPVAVRWFGEGRLRYQGGHAWLDGSPLEAPVVYCADDVGT